MTLPPPGPPPGEPLPGPAAQPGPPGPPPPVPGHSEAPTRYIPRQPGPTEQIPQQIPYQPYPPQPGVTPPGLGQPDLARDLAPEKRTLRGLFSDPLSVILSLVIVAALGLAALLGGEFYARHQANTIVAKAVSCVVQDSATASFGPRPFLLQHFTHSYRDMRVETAGNQIREAKGMKLQLRLDDVRINPTAESTGTLGSLDADITWSADGIQKTVSGLIPLVGGLISGVTPDASAGTLQLLGPLGTVTIKPQVADGGLSLQVVGVTGLGFTLPSEAVQPALDAFTGQLTRNLPMGIHAESVAVTDSGVTARFVTHDATIPTGQQDPCFAGVGN